MGFPQIRLQVLQRDNSQNSHYRAHIDSETLEWMHLLCQCSPVKRPRANLFEKKREISLWLPFRQVDNPHGLNFLTGQYTWPVHRLQSYPWKGPVNVENTSGTGSLTGFSYIGFWWQLPSYHSPLQPVWEQLCVTSRSRNSKEIHSNI